MRNALTTAVEVVGAVAITAGAAMVAVPAGLVVGGVFAIVAGYLFAEADS
jgi:hypothetical protein